MKGVLDRFGQIAPKILFCADGYRYAGKEIEISVNDSPTGTVSLSGATPAIDEALAGASCR